MIHTLTIFIFIWLDTCIHEILVGLASIIWNSSNSFLMHLAWLTTISFVVYILRILSSYSPQIHISYIHLINFLYKVSLVAPKINSFTQIYSNKYLAQETWFQARIYLYFHIMLVMLALVSTLPSLAWPYLWTWQVLESWCLLNLHLFFVPSIQEGVLDILFERVRTSWSIQMHIAF